ncbi:disease resistance-like protein DSC1 isoform X1 [Pyrus x bretschneideri]|uniref:disease resistance-like protein DSC1 isoform X1 n=1 Tax=Pyrus x bretschneideri TaxID=225117 RepID=UPI00202ED98D|nr:disease resistance-like protein DSC1 isoform X1 [Pyrus x bretschneideri]XP_048421347.1 disease resistance-like protein DSC1 isoform X1 [Pyrus x bretschneideri]
MASSSSPPPFSIPPAHREKHDVFISFRGEDTRRTFTSHLHHALLSKNIETYMDTKIHRGDEIAPSLLDAIEKSKLSVIIFSQNYACSKWCLIELVHIMECKKKNGQTVLPIFYDISPSDLRKENGIYANAIADHEKCFEGSMDKVHKWRAALADAANLSGFDNSNKTGTEAELVKKVVDDIWTKLNEKSSTVLKGLVGMERRFEHIESSLCLDSPDVYSIGIWGMGGIGKTTLADVVFHRLSSKFEASCFLGNVREKSEQKDGLVHLRNTLLSEILKEKDLNIGTPTIGSDLVRKRMGRMKVLIVLDDVNDANQLSFLAGDPVLFGPGSRIIITTIDRSLLQTYVDHNKIYEVERLNFDEALQLFHLSAFKNNIPREDYTEVSKVVVEYAGGIPLALQILGSSFLHCESKADWVEELKEFGNEKIWKVLRQSYDGLNENEKEILLDIACFYQGKDVYIVQEMLHMYGFRAAGIRVLTDKSLISVSTNNSLEMHNLLQEMGIKIFRKQCIEEPRKCNRLVIVEDVNHELKTNTEKAMIQAILFSRSEIRGMHLNHADFKKIYDLKLLYVYSSSRNMYCKVKVSLPHSLTLDLEGYPFKYFPSKISSENLVEIQMHNSHIEQLWNEGQNLRNLKVMDLGSCDRLIKVPDLSQSPNIEHIDLHGCKSLVEIPSYFQYLEKLSYLNLTDCTKLKYLSEMPHSIEYLYLDSTAIEDLPSSVWSLEKLCSLDIHFCENLKNLPSNTCNLKVSGSFSLKGCSSLVKFSELPRNITKLDLSGTAIEVLPASALECLLGLGEIKLNNCKMLVSLPESIGNLKSLERLDLSGTTIKSLPASIKEASRLRWLWLTNCRSLESLPKLPGVRWLQAHGCTSLNRVSLKTALALDWDGYKHFRGIQEQFTFSNCGVMVRHVRGYIMADALIRIMRMATALSKYLEQEEIEVASHLELEEESNEYVFRSLVCVVCIGGEIPSWFRDSCDQSSIRIKLSPKHFGGDFLGFAYSAVVAFDNYNVQGSLKLGCKINFKANGDHRFCHRSCMVADYGEISDYSLNTPHVFIWFSTFDRVEKGNLNGVTDAIFEFYPVIDQRPDGRAVDCSNIIVTKCGTLPMYLGDDWKLKGLKASYAAVDLMSKMVTSRQTQRS